MVYEKADFYSAYGFYPVDPDTGIRYAGAKIPEFPGQEITLRLHYHPYKYRQVAEVLADKLIKEKNITKDDVIIIFGGAYGWLGEALIVKTGCSAVSVDLSDYIQSTKDLSADDELIEAITASGYDPLSGVGLYLFNKFSDPRSRAVIEVLQEDLSSPSSINRVKKALPSNPSKIITEEVWQLFSEQERLAYTSRLDNFGSEVIHIIDGVII
jgi:hypothetical protein